ncbi:DUF1659 domain-containing protein [Aliibacillus thermotolerans]|uniref:DUF1659 domain-containing protein n=1 Tax=Aliibacillus thermotolerans TaxID=1834418 RepID=A0ABW0U2S9_9BACI|nr:DUF1659 domain-containing protein [Aliibacillus thermotolerans]
MAEMMNSRLTLELDGGVNEHGETVFKYKHFNNVKVNAEDASLREVAYALSTLQERPLLMVRRVNEYDIS